MDTAFSPELASITDHFSLDGAVQHISPIGMGHINDTWEIACTRKNDKRNIRSRYCMQRVNHHVFSDVPELMSNIEKVTGHLQQKVRERGGDPSRESLTLVPARNGQTWVEKDGSYFRMYRYIEDSYVVSSTPDLTLTALAGEAFGAFLKDLSTYDGEPLSETIVDFHNTPFRYRQLNEAIEQDVWNRGKCVAREIEFALSRKDTAGVIAGSLEQGKLPRRIIHNDTKINNVLFDTKTHAPLCVIDLDTIMPGSFLYDFGDAVRVATSTAAEDEPDLSLVTFSISHFEALVQGFLKEGTFLTPLEIDYLPLAAVIMTLECGIRFLTDHLEGDSYFRVIRNGQNLDRCRTQFRMVEEMEKALPLMKAIVKGVSGV